MAEPIVWNPCPECAAALRYVLETRGPDAMGVMVGPIIRMCLECSKVLPPSNGAGELVTKLKLNLPD